MSDPNLTPSPDEVPSVDEAEQVEGHPQTEGLEQLDDGSFIGNGVIDSEFGQDPDVESHTRGT